MNYFNRHVAVRHILEERQLAALIFFGMTNVRYLSGFSGTDGVFICTSSETIFLTDSRYTTQAQNQVIADRVVCYSNKLQAVADELASLRLARAGFDADAISVALFDKLKGLIASETELVPCGAELEALRACKDSDEIFFLKQAADLNRQAFEAVLPKIVPGVSEKAIALELEFTLKRLGGEENSFDFIVASGDRGALPHGVASDKIIKDGELVTIDFGTRVGGYCSDETVTVAVGNVEGKLRQIFDIVLEAHDSALREVKAGIKIATLDQIARDYIKEQGYGEFFGHGLGHGVGLDIHEFPSVSSRSTESLQEGMIITIEPGIYIPNLGGVRIEDSVIVTASGYELLTRIPKLFRQAGC